MRVLLTGASGFLGRYIYEALTELSYEVVTLGRHPSNDVQVDLGKEVPQLTGLFDLVIHAVGKAHSLPKNDEEAQLFFAVNTQGTRHLCDALNQHLSEKACLVFISSIAVYGLAEGQDIEESQPVAPISPYGKSKWMAENILAEWCRDQCVPLTIFRLPLIVGRNAPGNLKDMINAIRRGFYFTLSGVPGKKSMVLARDVAELIPRAAGTPGIFHLTDGIHPTMGQLAAALARVLKKRAPRKIPSFIIALAARIGDLSGGRLPIDSARYRKLSATLTFTSQKAVLQLGWTPTPVLEAIESGDIVAP
jgi:nucleoside-diphosphate-sugar epimerase